MVFLSNERRTINCTADQRLCIHYTDSAITLIPKSEISNLLPSSVVVSDLVGNLEDRLSREAAHIYAFNNFLLYTTKNENRWKIKPV